MNQLPSYAAPPIVETAIALQFRPLKGFKNAHLWGFWSRICDDYPVTEDQEPLDSKTELFGDDIRREPRLPQLQFRPHASRLQALSDDRHAMVQIQNGRFIFNWRRLDSGAYPRWSKTFAEFQRRYDQFIQFVSDEGLGQVDPNQWEVTYVNHLLKGGDWESEGEWPQLVPGLVGACQSVSAGDLEAIDCRVQFVLPEERARLYIDLKKAVLTSNTDQELLTLTLTARGGVSPNHPAEEGLALGRTSIVTSFTQITGESAQKRWGREQ